MDTSTEIIKRNILEKDCIYVAQGIVADCLQQNEQGHSTKKKHSITEKTFICGFKASDDAKPCPKKFERKAYRDQHLNGHFGKKLKTYFVVKFIIGPIHASTTRTNVISAKLCEMPLHTSTNQTDSVHSTIENKQL